MAQLGLIRLRAKLAREAVASPETESFLSAASRFYKGRDLREPLSFTVSSPAELSDIK
ncbi:MAG: hypothetical protein ACR2M8_12590 [Pyrinomonadaceae bacterium]|nr:hypothetical protein [Acidobacteriota bacterium]